MTAAGEGDRSHPGRASCHKANSLPRTTQSALRAYDPGRYDGRVLLVLAGTPPAADEDPPAAVQAWSRLAATVDVEWCPATTTPWSAPRHAERLAQLIAARLDGA